MDFKVIFLKTLLAVNIHKALCVIGILDDFVSFVDVKYDKDQVLVEP